MTDTEEQIVAAMQLQAERRPDGAAVREALAKGRSWRRGRHTAMIALVAAAVVAIAITVPLVLNRGGTPSSAAAVPANQPAFWQQAMAYEPGWLPDDIVESERLTGAKSVLRIWRMPVGSQWPGPTVTLGVSVEEPMPRTDDMTVIDVHGLPAYVLSQDTQGHDTEVRWQPKPHVQVRLTVEGGLHHHDIAVHIAQALRTDGTEQVRPLIDLGWCPFTDLGTWTTPPTLGGHDPEGSASCTRGDLSSVAEVDVFIDRKPSITSGTEVAVRGKQGLYTKKGSQQDLSVQLDNGMYMNLQATGDKDPASKADVIKIADAAVVHDAAYLTWFGSR